MFTFFPFTTSQAKAEERETGDIIRGVTVNDLGALKTTVNVTR